MPLFLGLDCGGSTTRALVVDDEDTVVFEGTGGPANLASTLQAQVSQSLRDATRGMPAVDSVAGCFAGLLGPERQRAAMEHLSEIAPGVKCDAYADYVATLAAAPDGTDVVVVSGTGSVVCWYSQGQPRKVGGGGPLLGDLGSAFDVGRTAVRLRWMLDRGKAPDPETDAFWAFFEKTYGTRDADAAPAAVHSAPNPAAALATFAGFIGGESAAGRTYASKAVRASMASLAKLAVDPIGSESFWTERKAKRDIHIALAGGLWQAHEVYEKVFRELLMAELAQFDPTGDDSRQYHVERLAAPPVLGAAKLAKRLFYGN